MRTSIKVALLASSIVGLALAAGPAAFARHHDYNNYGGGISFALETGGYCDNAGCPDHFWRYPVHYGPVFAGGRWFRGPVDFRGDRYGREYWVHGGWHRDDWQGRRPPWARASHDGPPLAFEYYADHGFQVGDHWRHEHDDDNGHHDWNGGDHHDQGGGDSHDHHDHGGDNGGDWHNGDNANRDNGNGGGGDPHRDNGGNGDWHRDNGGHGDWHANGSGDPNNDHGRTWDDHGRADNGGQGDQHGGNGNGQGSDRNGMPPAGNTIHVTSATYGAVCHQPAGNVTKFLADACNGRGTCDYVVQYQTIGDPSPGCAKDFSVQWTCSIGPGGTAGAPAEAGLGSKVTLQCANTGH